MFQTHLYCTAAPDAPWHSVYYWPDKGGYQGPSDCHWMVPNTYIED